MLTRTVVANQSPEIADSAELDPISSDQYHVGIEARARKARLTLHLPSVALDCMRITVSLLWGRPTTNALIMCVLLLLFTSKSAASPPLYPAGSQASDNTEQAIPPPVARKVDFVHDIKPILSGRCYFCHGEKMQSGGLRLDLREPALQGGASGPAILPGASADSRLIQFVAGIPPEKLMPQVGGRLSDEEIGLLRAWIDQGATWPDQYDATKHFKSDDHWAYQPLLPPELPEVQNSSWPKTAIDHFILDRLEERGFKPSEPAGKRTLLRRITLDLTGLQPTPEEYRDFLKDGSPNAVIRVVDRLLNSPRYGERWARHWMDAVHYADSQGHDQDRPRDNSWPYRDYLIRSFNQDKPYARFVEEQIAGDVLNPNDPDAIVATGFIATGPFDESSMIFIVDDTVDKKQAQNLDRDDMLTTTMSTFLSTTIHCARCHDHKFDPITQAEYYNLQSVFAGVDRADRPFDPDRETHILRQSLLRKRIDLEVRQKHLNDQVNAITAPEIDQLETHIESLEKERKAKPKPVEGATSSTLGFQSQVSSAEHKEKWVQVDLLESIPIHQIYLVPVDRPDRPGFAFPARFRVDISNDPLFVNFQTVADHTKVDFPNPGLTPYPLRTEGQVARYIRVTSMPPATENDYWLFALSELLAFSNRENTALKGRVTASDSVESQPSELTGKPRWSKANLVDGYTSLVSLDSLGLAAESPKNGYMSEVVKQSKIEKWVQVDLGKPVPIQEVRLLPAQPKTSLDKTGLGFPPRFKIEGSRHSDFEDRQTLSDHTEEDFPDPGMKELSFSGKLLECQFIRVTATLLAPVADGYAFALAELQVYSGDENVAFGAKVTALDFIDDDQWTKRALVDNYSSQQGIGNLARALKSAHHRSELGLEIGKLKEQQTALAHSLLDPALQSELEEVERNLKDVNRQLSSMPPARMVYSGTPDFAVFNKFKPTKGIPRSISVLRRGEITQPIEPAHPGALSLIRDLDPHFELEDSHREGSRRAALARWITNPKNVLTWRSVVNRVWHHHFERGLVDTPGDFGHMGSRPSHPELLDWLAQWFLENGGSIKKLHRLILTSSVYAQSSQGNPEYAKIDAENRVLWRMNRRRLDAESVRDSVLQASGKLDLTVGGPPVKQFDYQDPNPSVTPLIGYQSFDPDNPANYRRSVFRWIFRTRPDPFMEVLDSPDSSELVATRTTSTTSLQALAMWNNPFILSQSRHLAARVAAEAGEDVRAQLEAAYQLVLGRAPTGSESEELVAYANEHGMASVCRLIFNTNEFMFVN